MLLFGGDLPRTATRVGVLVGSRQKSYGMLPLEVDHGHVCHAMFVQMKHLSSSWSLVFRNAFSL